MICNTRSIVITGSTRGTGNNLAAAFLERDCAVTISFAPAARIMLKFLTSPFNKRDLFT